MSTNTERAPVETSAERPAPRTDLDTQGKHGQPQGAKTLRWLSIEMIGEGTLPLSQAGTLVPRGDGDERGS